MQGGNADFGDLIIHADITGAAETVVERHTFQNLREKCQSFQRQVALCVPLSGCTIMVCCVWHCSGKPVLSMQGTDAQCTNTLINHVASKHFLKICKPKIRGDIKN